MKQGKENIYLLILLLTVINLNCFGFLKPVPIVEDELIDAVINDTHFILLNSDSSVQTKPDFTDIKSKLKTAKGPQSLSQSNNLAVYRAKLGDIEKSEELFKSTINSFPAEKIPVLNYLRLNYLLNEYPLARKTVQEYFERNGKKKEVIVSVLDSLKNSGRKEEYIICLDTISSYSDFEMSALENLGEYFLNDRDYKNAEFYFEKILSIFAFHKAALRGMMHVSADRESWNDVYLYGKPLISDMTMPPDYYYLMLKALYETGNYAEAVNFASKSPEPAKQSLDFLLVWRDSLHCNDPKASTDQVARQIKTLKNKKTLPGEELLLPASSPEGKSLYNDIMNGY